MPSCQETVIREIQTIFQNKGQTPPPLDGNTPLDTSLGLESLDFAELAVRMEQIYGFDPFAASSVSVVTLSDLASLYETK